MDKKYTKPTNIKRRFAYGFCFPLLWLAISCQSKKESTAEVESQNDNEKLEINSSFKVATAGIQLLDHLSEPTKFLGYNKYTKSLLIVDANGSILKRKNAIGNGPGEVGNAFDSALFLDENRVAVLSQRGLWVYNLNFELINFHKIESDSFITPVGFLDNKVATINNDQKDLILRTSSFRIPLKEYNPGFLKSEAITNKFSVGDNETTLTKQQLTLDNLYNNEETFFLYFTPVLASSQKHKVFYMATPYGNTIYQMPANSNTWEVFMKDLDLEGLEEPNGVPFDEQNKNINPMFGMTEKEMVYVETNGRILRIFTSQNRIGIIHKTSLPEKYIPATSKNLYTLSKKHQKFYLSIFENEKKIFESDISQYSNWKNMLMLDDNTFLFEKLAEEDIEPNETIFEILSFD